MRAQASLANAGKAGSRSTYTSLMSRLAALQQGGPQAAQHGAGRAAMQATAYRRRVLRTYFGCGLVASLLIGCALLVPLLYAQPGVPRDQRLLGAVQAGASSTHLRSDTGTPHSVARIRLLDDSQPGKAHVASIADRASAQRSDALLNAKPRQQRSSDANLARRAGETTPKQKTAQKPATLPTGKPQVGATEDTPAALTTGSIRHARPEGMSALGALARVPEQERRQLWWKMPLPSWVPFNDAAGRN